MSLSDGQDWEEHSPKQKEEQKVPPEEAGLKKCTCGRYTHCPEDSVFCPEIQKAREYRDKIVRDHFQPPPNHSLNKEEGKEYKAKWINGLVLLIIEKCEFLDSPEDHATLAYDYMLSQPLPEQGENNPAENAYALIVGPYQELTKKHALDMFKVGVAWAKSGEVILSLDLDAYKNRE